MALGALAASLVMGIFAAARHYAQASLPSTHTVSVSTVQNATHANATAITAQPIATVEKASLRTTSVKSNSDPRKPKRRTAAVKPRIHHNPDEDYVAKDTYVRYDRSSR